MLLKTSGAFSPPCPIFNCPFIDLLLAAPGKKGLFFTPSLTVAGGMGGPGGMGGGRNSNKTKPMVHKLKVSLEDLYNGKTKKLAANRDIQCADCDGKGGTKVERCILCKGMKTYYPK